MADKMKKAKFGSLQLDVEDVISWSELTNADFAPASSQEKENFIQDRESVSFWKDGADGSAKIPWPWWRWSF